jgi:hypothetical protein
LPANIGRCSSLPSDPRGLDDRPPLVHLGNLERGETLRRLLLARGDVEAELGKTRSCGSASACTIAALSFATTSAGVPLGA